MKILLYYKKWYIWVLYLFFPINLVLAQDYQENNVDFEKGTELYEVGNYQIARTFFQKCITKQSSSLSLLRRALFFKIMCDQQLNNELFVSSAQRFLTQYPTSQEAYQLKLYLGNYFFQQHDYEVTKSYLEQVNSTHPKTASEIETTYKLAYALFALRKYDESYQLFNLVKRKNHPYRNASLYYSAYIQYLNQEYEEAMRALRRIDRTFEGQEDVFQLIARILFVNKEYERSVHYTKKCIKKYPDNFDLNYVLGNSYYALNQYVDALPFLKKCLIQDHQNASLSFQVGMCFLKQLRPLESVQYFRSSTELAPQKIPFWYHLGVACSKLKHKKYLEIAQEAFKYCRKPAQYMPLHELSALNYVNISHKLLDYESVLEGCEFYRSHYPEGEFLQNINHLTLKAITHGNDYFGAVEYLKKIKDKTPDMKKAYQRALFNKSVELFQAKNYEQAYHTFYTSLEYPYDRKLVSQANYWLAEINLRTKDYMKALKYYTQIPVYAPEYVKSLYGIGYAHFQLRQYKKACLFFEEFLKFEKVNIKQRIEAQTRIADCQLAERNYTKALQQYDILLSSSVIAHTERGYFLLQKGVVMNYLKKFTEAIELFSQIFSNFSKEYYLDRAYWYQAESYIGLTDYVQAIKSLNHLVRESNHENLRSMALFRRAKMYQKTNAMPNAIRDFRRLIYQNPDTKMSMKALKKLEEIHQSHVKVYDLEKLYQYVGSYNNLFLKSEIINIRNTYHNKRYNLVIARAEKFITRFPHSDMKYQARYWMASAFWEMKNKKNALKNLRLVQGNYQQKAQRKISQIIHFKAAPKSFNQLENVEELIARKNFTEARNITHKYYRLNTHEGEKAVYYTMLILLQTQDWSSLEATFYHFKKRFPKSKKYYDAVLILAESKMYAHKKMEAKALIQEVLDHCKDKVVLIKARALRYKM